MEEQNISSGKMTFKFIWHFILYRIVLSIIVGFLYSLIYGKINIFILLVLDVILSGISIFLATKLSLKDIFTSNKLKEEDKKKFKRNIIIFFALIIFGTLFLYAFLFAIIVAVIEVAASGIQVAEGQDITGALDLLKTIALVVTFLCAFAKSGIYIGMMKYKNKYLK